MSAVMTSVAGTFYAQYVLFIDPYSCIYLQISIAMCLMAVLGGLGTLWGPVIGAAVLILDPGEAPDSAVGGTGQRPGPVDLRLPGHGGGGLPAQGPDGAGEAIPPQEGVDMALLEINNVTKRFGGLVANDKVSFDVNEGEIVGLIGPNGAGEDDPVQLHRRRLQPRGRRTSASRARISRITRPEQACDEGVARTFQIVRVFKEMTVLDNVMVGAYLRARAATPR